MDSAVALEEEVDSEVVEVDLEEVALVVEVDLEAVVLEVVVDLEVVLEDLVDQQLFKNTFMFMFHHQSQKNSVHKDQFQLDKPKSTIKSFSSRPHLPHLTNNQSSQSNHKTKKRPSSMFW